VLLLHLEALGSGSMMLAAASILIVLAGRLAGVAIPLGVLAKPCGFERGMLPVLTWSGLRGGISIALALSLPDIPHRHLMLVCTYAVVVFSLLGQGLTLARVIRAATRRRATRAPR
jgi:CPA1 family monovalent cation:H+ antiporter